MKNSVIVSGVFIFLNFLPLGKCGYLDEFYDEPRIYIQTQNYTINLIPLLIPLCAFTLGKDTILLD